MQIGQAQLQYEEDEWEKIQEANELQRQGHTLQCAANQVWCNRLCTCGTENWRESESV